MIRKYHLRSGSIWNDPRTKIVQALAFEGFTHDVCAHYAGLSRGQAGYRLFKIGIKTTAIRRAEGKEVKKRIRRVLNGL